MTDTGHSVEEVGHAKDVGEKLLGARTYEDGREAASFGFGPGLYGLGLALQKPQTAQRCDACTLHADWRSVHQLKHNPRIERRRQALRAQPELGAPETN